MCSIAAAGLALTAIGTISSFMGQRQEAASVQQQGQFTQDQLDFKARDAEQRGEIAAAKEQLRARQIRGLQKASLAGLGRDVNLGSAAQLGLDISSQGRINAANQRAAAAREAFGFRQQGAIAFAEGSNRASAINAEASASLLSGAGSVASKWYGYRTDGKDPFFG